MDEVPLNFSARKSAPKGFVEYVSMFEKAVEENPKQEWIVGNLADAYRWSGRRDTFEEGTWAAWLYDLLKPYVTRI